MWWVWEEWAVFLPGTSQTSTHLINDVLYEPRHHWHVRRLQQEQEDEAEAAEDEDGVWAGLAQQLPHHVTVDWSQPSHHTRPAGVTIRLGLKISTADWEPAPDNGTRNWREREREHSRTGGGGSHKSGDNGNRWILTFKHFLYNDSTGERVCPTQLLQYCALTDWHMVTRSVERRALARPPGVGKKSGSCGGVGAAGLVTY